MPNDDKKNSDFSRGASQRDSGSGGLPAWPYALISDDPEESSEVKSQVSYLARTFFPSQMLKGCETMNLKAICHPSDCQTSVLLDNLVRPMPALWWWRRWSVSSSSRHIPSQSPVKILMPKWNIFSRSIYVLLYFCIMYISTCVTRNFKIQEE